MAPVSNDATTKKHVSFEIDDEQLVDEQVQYGPHAVEVERDDALFGLPAKQGLYNPDNEKDSCGVGFVAHIKGQPSHKIVSDARSLLECMTHRGATGILLFAPSIFCDQRTHKSWR